MGAPHPDTARVLADVAARREQQVEKGWTREHDDTHDTSTLIELAYKYANRSGKGNVDPYAYDRDRLLDATALLAAAIEAMDRREGR